jgi:hypothetical protein
MRTPIWIFSPASLLSDTINCAGVPRSRPSVDMLVAPFDFQLLCSIQGAGPAKTVRVVPLNVPSRAITMHSRARACV